MDYQAAKESAFDTMLPKKPEEFEDWEREGAEQDAIGAFGEWIVRQNFGDGGHRIDNDDD